MENMIHIEIALMGLAIHILIWDKLPEWGTWFTKLINFLPKPLRTLYEGWRCPYCFGFWIALALHGFTGVWTLPILSDVTSAGIFGVIVSWFLDALAGGTLIYFASHLLGTLSWGAAKGYFAAREFKASFNNHDAKE